jgi:hypothetical protein
MSNYRVRLRGEQGMALIGVLLLLILASGVCAALAVSGRTETAAAFNVNASAQARAAAQAGLTASAEVLITYLTYTPLDVKTAMTAVLRGPDANASTTADNGSLFMIDGATTGLPPPGVTLTLSDSAGTSYEVQVLDDDNWSARGVSPAGSSANIEEDDVITTDDNKRIVVRAVGYGRSQTTVVLEAIIARPELGGIVVGGDLRLSGSAGSVTGAGADVHANGNITVNGHPVVDGTVSAVGTVSGSPSADQILQHQSEVSIPPINASDFVNWADWYLTSSGVVRKRVSGVFINWCTSGCTAAANGGVSFSSGRWTIRPAANGRYFVDAAAQSGGDFNATVYATGDISIGNNDDVTAAANAKGVALVSDGNIDIGGGANVTGSIYAREEVDFGGNHVIVGQVVAENRSNPNAENRFHGNVDIVWNGDTMIGDFGVSSWREAQ